MSKEKMSEPVSIFPNEQGYYVIEDSFKNLAGKILTIIDAVITDQPQNKAVKDLVKNEFREKIDYFQQRCSDGKTAHSINL